ncbi:MAG: hypothetical protein ABI367_08580 [Mucilaginibacter sp.]
MKKLLKSILPPLIGFFIYFTVIRYSGYYFTLKINEMGGGDIRSFMAYYRYMLPLLFVVAILTQLLVIVPVWDNAWVNHITSKINAFIDLVFICLVFALGISYIIWDTSSGFPHFIKLAEFMIGIQLVYWVINITTLYIIE